MLSGLSAPRFGGVQIDFHPGHKDGDLIYIDRLYVNFTRTFGLETEAERAQGKKLKFEYYAPLPKAPKEYPTTRVSYELDNESLCTELSPEALESDIEKQHKDFLRTKIRAIGESLLEAFDIPRGFNGERDSVQDDENIILTEQHLEKGVIKVLLRRFLAEDLKKADSVVRQMVGKALEQFPQIPADVSARIQTTLTSNDCYASLQKDGGLCLGFTYDLKNPEKSTKDTPHILS